MRAMRAEGFGGYQDLKRAEIPKPYVADGRVLTRPEGAHGRDARRWWLRRAAPPAPGVFRQTNPRTAWGARPVDDGSYRGDCARHWQTGFALRVVSDQVLTQMGVPPKGAALYIEMY